MSTTIRTLGEGFGRNNEFYLSLNEVNRGLIHALPKELQAHLCTWINEGGKARSIHEILDAKSLAAVMPDLLIDLDIPTLAKIELGQEIETLITKRSYIRRLDGRFVTKLSQGSPSSNLLRAYLLPAVLEVMDAKDREFVAKKMAERLLPKHFQMLVDPLYFQVQLQSRHHPIALNSNGRSLRFFPQSAESRAHFRGKEWTLDHTHIHFELDGEEREYVLEPSPFQVAGEVHTVFSRVSKQGYKKYMAVGMPLTIGAPNKVLRRLFTQKVPSFNFQNIFMAGFDPNTALYHSWASLQSKTPAFQDGLRFAISPKPMELSQDQYKRLKALFGEMSDLDPAKVLNPIDRKAYRRPKL